MFFMKFKGRTKSLYNTYTCTYIYLKDAFDVIHKFDVYFPFYSVSVNENTCKSTWYAYTVALAPELCYKEKEIWCSCDMEVGFFFKVLLVHLNHFLSWRTCWDIFHWAIIIFQWRNFWKIVDFVQVIAKIKRNIEHETRYGSETKLNL